MRGEYDARIARAQHLIKKFPASAGLLDFYIKLATLQKEIYAGLPSRSPSAHLSALIEIVKSHGPAPLVLYASTELNRDQRERIPEDPQSLFFARVLDQPEAEYQAAHHSAALTSAPTCPQCASKPVAAVLRGEGDGAKRSLLCSLCSTEWPFRRVLCPNCAEEDKDRLPIYTAAGIDHVRVEACDTCRTYIKSINLTKEGFAVPEVDELATVALDVWADDNGYTKLEPNILGM
jgi:FdhE protein